MKFYKYKYLRDTTKKPFNAHLIVEASDGDLYVVDSADQTKLYKSDDKGVSWDLIADWTPKIQALWYDRTNEKIYCGASNQNDLRSYIYSVDLSDDSVTDEWNSSPVNIYDVFIIPGSNPIHYLGKAMIYTVGVGGWSLDSDVPGATVKLGNFVVVIGTKVYFIRESNVPNFDIIYWDDTARDDYFVEKSIGVGVDFPPNNMQGIAYDGSDTLYFILQDTGDSKYYLYNYKFSTGVLTKGIEYNISLMLDRNTASGLYERAFHTSNYYVYQIHRGYIYLSKIDEPDLSDTILAVSDNFLFTNDNEIWEWSAYEPDILSCNIDSKIQAIQTANITTDLDFNYNQIIKIYDDNDVLGFEGLITEKIIHEYYKEYNCISFNREVINKKFTETYSAQTAKEIAEDFLTDNCNYLYFSSSIDPDGDFLTDYNIEFKNCSIKEALDTLADLEDAIWWIDPDGKVWMKKFSRLTACGDTVDETTGNVVSIPKLTITSQTYNKVTIYGAINPATGASWKTGSGHGEDLASQTQYGIIEYVDYYPQLHTQADVDAMSDALIARTGMVSNPFKIEVDIAGLDYTQVGKTIDFSLDKPGFTDYIGTNDTYVILGDNWNAKEDIHSFTISTGIIQGKEQGKSRNIRTMAVDEEQIDNLAEIVYEATEAPAAGINKRIWIHPFPDSGFTSGNSNVWYQAMYGGDIYHGITSKGVKFARISFRLPADYKTGTDIRLYMFLAAGGAVATIDSNMYACSIAMDALQTWEIAGSTTSFTYTALSAANKPQLGYFLLDNATMGFTAGDVVSVAFSLDDNGAASHIRGFGHYIRYTATEVPLKL